jgi:hypothetical protein
MRSFNSLRFILDDSAGRRPQRLIFYSFIFDEGHFYSQQCLTIYAKTKNSEK